MGRGEGSEEDDGPDSFHSSFLRMRTGTETARKQGPTQRRESLFSCFPTYLPPFLPPFLPSFLTVYILNDASSHGFLSRRSPLILSSIPLPPFSHPSSSSLRSALLSFSHPPFFWLAAGSQVYLGVGRVREEE